MLCRLRLEFTGRLDIRYICEMYVECIASTNLVAKLSACLKEGKRLDITNRTADFTDDDVVLAIKCTHPTLDFVGDVRYNLDCLAKVFTLTLPHDYVIVDLTRRRRICTRHIDVEEALVMAKIKVCFGTIIGNEYLTMLVGIHRAGVDVDVGVELLNRDREATLTEQETDG